MKKIIEALMMVVNNALMNIENELTKKRRVKTRIWGPMGDLVIALSGFKELGAISGILTKITNKEVSDRLDIVLSEIALVEQMTKLDYKMISLDTREVMMVGDFVKNWGKFFNSVEEYFINHIDLKG